MTQPTRNILTVSRLNQEARELLETGLGRLWVEGEISNLARPASGHLYFTLKDARAQVSCALFRNRAVRLRFSPENGAQVLIRGQVSLYEARGNYQLIVDQMEEAGDGALRRAFEELKTRLFNEGLFDEAGKQPLPDLPRCIGVITSPSGAAIRDVLTVLKRRFPGIPVIIYPTRVQGEGAAEEIVAALRTANKRADCDVLLLTRGGGSLEDLWPFNEEKVARAVAASSLPLVSAVGHEVDVVITDFVADARAATPSAAAELLSPDRDEVITRVKQLAIRLKQQVTRRLQRQHEQFDWLVRRLQQRHPGHYLDQQIQRLDELEQRLNRAMQQQITQRQARLQTASAKLRQHHPGRLLESLEARNRDLAQRLRYCINIQLSKYRGELATLSRTLETVSPLATLQRGYSITLAASNGSIITDSGQTRPGDTLETRLAKGRIFSTVTDTES
ncbi:exodeoxyribonuclease VII large subunit [Thiogranum longum]|uniref:Exodeoxyribonuclease 7 large subunit n=1 Tax=Thiogranum longum TaxID=1537524 RepID=A0A4R1H8C7_9GAMM|nr:exodeoxyribonuclease VII large subunit [Thiogranum longum]TCK17488.1 exodeoxyribonuclease VII large subunit [Thiogranum longum]